MLSNQNTVRPKKSKSLLQFIAPQDRLVQAPQDTAIVSGKSLLQFIEKAPTVEKFEEPTKGFFTQLKEAFTGENLIDPATANLPEIGEVETDSKLKVLGSMLSAVTPEEQANILESNIEGLTQRKDLKGNIIVKFPNGNEAFVNKAGLSMTDFRNLVAEGIQFFPAAKLAGLGRTFLSKAGLGAAGAGATQAVKETIQEQIGGEFEPSEIATATAAGIVGEAIPAFIKNLRRSRQAKRIGAEEEAIGETAETIKQAQEATEATGVELFPAQKTLTPSALEEQAFIATLPSAQKKSVIALKTQNKQVGEAVESFLESIARADVVQTGAERFRTASQKAIDVQNAIRDEKTSGLFNEAFRLNPKPNLKPVSLKIKEILRDVPKTRKDEVFSTMQDIKELFKGSTNLRQLQNVKFALDRKLSKVGTDALDRITKRLVIKVKKELLNEMDRVSPSYKEARELFASASPAVTELEKSILGKIAKLDDTQLKSVSRKIFDPEELNVQTVLKTKKIIESVDPEAWNELLRTELERRLGSIKPDAIKGAGLTVENLPDQLNRAIFGNEKQARILKNAASPEQRKNLNYLQTVLKRASAGRLGGSPTATRGEITERLRRGVISFLSNTFTPLEGAKKGLIASTFDKNVKKMAAALFDTKWQPQLSKIRKINPNTPAAARLWTQLLNDIENEKEAK